MRSWVAAVAALFLMTAGPAVAQTVGTTVDPGAGFFILDTQTVVGQRIVAPGPAVRLQSFRLTLGRLTPTLSVVPEVYEVTSGGATGVGALTVTLVWSGPATPVTDAAADYVFTPDITLDPARIYAVAVRQANAGEQGRVLQAAPADYGPGDVMIRNSASNFVGPGAVDLGFQAVFAPAAIPTVSDWALIGLGLLLAGSAVLLVQGRRPV